MSNSNPQEQSNQQGHNNQNNYQGHNQTQIHNSNNDKGLEYMNQELQYKNKIIERKDAQINALMNRKNYILYAAIIISLIAVIWVESIKNTPPQVAYQKKPDTVFIERTKDKKEGSSNQINNSVKSTPQPATPSNKKPLKVVQKSFKRELRKVERPINPAAFKPNTLLEDRIGKSSLIKPLANKSKVVNITGNKSNIIVVTFQRDSSLTDHNLILHIRSNNTLNPSIKKEKVSKSPSALVYYKEDFKPGVYYIEIISEENGMTFFTDKFTVNQ